MCLGRYSLEKSRSADCNQSRTNSIVSQSSSTSVSLIQRLSMHKRLSMRFRHSTGASSDCSVGDLDSPLASPRLDVTHPVVNHKKTFKFSEFLRRNRAKSNSNCDTSCHIYPKQNVIPQISIEAPKNDVGCQYSPGFARSDASVQTCQSGSPSNKSRCINRRTSSLLRHSRLKHVSNSDSEDAEQESKDDSVNSENETTNHGMTITAVLPSIVVTENGKGKRRKSSLFWRRLSLEFSSDDSRRGSLSPNISRRNSATNAERSEPKELTDSMRRRKRSEGGPNLDKWFPSLLHRVTNTASADWLPIASSRSVPEVSKLYLFSCKNLMLL